MKLYVVMFDHEQYFIEAECFAAAIEVWKGHVAELWGSDYNASDEPDSVQLVSDEPVIRLNK